jgi:hypothetical protein
VFPGINTPGRDFRSPYGQQRAQDITICYFTPDLLPAGGIFRGFYDTPGPVVIWEILVIENRYIFIDIFVLFYRV